MTKTIDFAGIVQDEKEINAVEEVLKSGWHVAGKKCQELQECFARYVGAKYCAVVNSGSSANLLALSALNLPRGSKVLTSACGFPATLNPIIHLGLKPIFVDYNLETLNIDLNQIEKALYEYWSDGQPIPAMIFAHTLGVPVNMHKLMKLANKYHCRVIEDCCEAVGSKYIGKYVGTFGEVGTYSFYPSHQMNAFGMGGCIVTNSEEIYKKCKSMRDWGKTSMYEGFYQTTLTNTVDGIPYDDQYTYETIGYNMRLGDANCAYAIEQLKKLNLFNEIRRSNYYTLRRETKDLPLIQPHLLYEDEAFFGYPIVLKKEGLRDKLVKHLENNGIHVRLFFAGNILRHPPYKNIEYETDVWDFDVANYLMRNGLFCGCWHGLNSNDMEYIGKKLKEFFNAT